MSGVDPSSRSEIAPGAPAAAAGDDLKARIDRARAAQQEPERASAADKYNQLTLAWRMTIELVVGTAMGFGIGWGLDFVFGSKPLFIVIFGILGFIAGIKVVIGTAKEVGRRAEATARRGEPEKPHPAAATPDADEGAARG